MTPNKFHHAGLDWIPHHPGDPMPCPGDTEVRVLLRDGRDGEGPARIGAWGQLESWYRELEIIGWHPMEQTNHELRKELG